jgi:isopropylmalate/homocitrate/citramalate synthase
VPSAAALLAGVPARVQVVEVGPRDGLQNESVVVATEDKVRFVEMLADAGLTEIEVSSFVSPGRVPQLADADAVFARLAPRSGVRYSALVPNARGLERALEAGVRSIALFTAASEAFTRRNIGMAIKESIESFRPLVSKALSEGVRVRAYVSTAFVCPYEGPISPAQVVPIVRELSAMGACEISMGDTIGFATPDAVARLTDAVQAVLPREQMAYHFHDTRGAALANVLMALEYGIAIFDSSAGGIGGCPFAPGAAGNLATEDLLALLHGMGIETGVDLQRVAAASRFLESRLGHALPSKALQTCERF